VDHYPPPPLHDDLLVGLRGEVGGDPLTLTGGYILDQHGAILA